jgi:hypothetical protein
MLNVNSVEQQLRKYADEPVIRLLDECDCKQQVSAVADLLKKIVIAERYVKNSKPEATSRRNTEFNCEAQKEENSRQRDRANADVQENVRRLEDRN